MAAGCVDAVGADGVVGVVATADGCALPAGAIEVLETGHPLPDQRGEAAASKILRFAQSADRGLLVLLSGGASSLLAAPSPPVRLDDLIAVNALLLASGADIEQVNTVRKHLSDIKGGGLLRAAPGPVATLAMSDVVGDDPGTIGSGPSVPDPTTFEDAWGVLEAYGVLSRVPRTVLDVLDEGRRGLRRETLKPSEDVARRSSYRIVASNTTALDAAAGAAREAGFEPEILPLPIAGDTTVAARSFAEGLIRRSASRPVCVLAGGETTVRLRGMGKGGRNQEFALAMAKRLSGAGWTVLSAGTDGVDGPTNAAGALVDGSTRQRAQQRGLDLALALADNDSYGFFASLGDLVLCGPTGTNVMDIKIALHPGRAGVRE